MLARYFQGLKARALAVLLFADGRRIVKPQGWDGILALAVYRLTFWVVFVLGLLFMTIISPVGVLAMVIRQKLRRRKNGR